MENRKLTILRAIVDEFVTSHEPVGSKAIAAKHALGVSPAAMTWQAGVDVLSLGATKNGCWACEAWHWA